MGSAAWSTARTKPRRCSAGRWPSAVWSSAARVWSQNTGPNTAACCKACRSSAGSRSSWACSTSLRVVGKVLLSSRCTPRRQRSTVAAAPSAGTLSVGTSSSTGTIAPWAISICTSSSMKNGLPPARSTSSACSARVSVCRASARSGTSSARANAQPSASTSGSRVMRWRSATRQSGWRSSSPGRAIASSKQAGAVGDVGAAERWRAGKPRRKSRLAVSAHCTSSASSTSGKPARAARRASNSAAVCSARWRIWPPCCAMPRTCGLSAKFRPSRWPSTWASATASGLPCSRSKQATKASVNRSRAAPGGSLSASCKASAIRSRSSE